MVSTGYFLISVSLVTTYPRLLRVWLHRINFPQLRLGFPLQYLVFSTVAEKLCTQKSKKVFL
jgi:hypothetical protein